MPQRIRQAVLVLATLAFSWYGMLAAHELGHVINAWVSGGSVEAVVLDPRQFSRTDVRPNPAPGFVAWGGVVWGTLLPVLVFLATIFTIRSRMYLAAFFAGFCCITNGVYLTVGGILGAGDAGDLLRHGESRWALFLFGLPVTAMGLFLWHGLGPFFGIGPQRLKIETRDVILTSAAALTILAFDIGWTLAHAAG